MGTSNKYSSDLWILSKQLPSWMREREGAGASYVIWQPTPLQGHASFNTKTEYILALSENIRGRNAVDLLYLKASLWSIPFMGCDPKATHYYEKNSQGRKQ